MDMLTAGGVSAGFQLLKVALALFTVYLMLRIFDESADVSFKENTLKALYEGNIAVGIYYGCRFLGAAILGGLTYIVPI